MALEKDDWLPEPPPPRPARRDSAIEAALRKFDGTEAAAPAPVQGSRRSWASTHRPAFAVLVSAMLLVVIGIPAALIGIRNQPSTSEQAPPRVAVHDTETAPRAAVAPAPVAETPSLPDIQPPHARKYRGADGAVVADEEPTLEAAPPAVAKPQAAAPAAVAAAPPPPPAPPQPPARAAKGAQEAAKMADNVVVTGSRIPAPELAAPNALESKAVGQSPYSTFLSRLQAAVRANDRRSVVAVIDLPLRVNFAGGARVYRDAASVQRDFDRIFTPKVRSAVLGQRPDRLFVRDQGAMVGDGELWFRETCPNAACSPQGPVRIVAINP